MGAPPDGGRGRKWRPASGSAWLLGSVCGPGGVRQPTGQVDGHMVAVGLHGIVRELVQSIMFVFSGTGAPLGDMPDHRDILHLGLPIATVQPPQSTEGTGARGGTNGGKSGGAGEKPVEKPFILREGLPPVPHKLASKILRGEYIDIAELLRTTLKCKDGRRPQLQQPLTPRPSSTPKSRREVPYILSWVQCFGHIYGGGHEQISRAHQGAAGIPDTDSEGGTPLWREGLAGLWCSFPPAGGGVISQHTGPSWTSHSMQSPSWPKGNVKSPKTACCAWKATTRRSSVLSTFPHRRHQSWLIRGGGQGMTRQLPSLGSPQCHGAKAPAAWPASHGTKGIAASRRANIAMCVRCAGDHRAPRCPWLRSDR